MNVEVIDKLRWLASKPKRIKIAVGGRGSGKSVGVSDLMLTYAYSGYKICATREFQNSIDDSVHNNLLEEIERLNLSGFSSTNNEITSSQGGRVFYKGLARNITSIKSLAAVDYLWIEEGESISEKSLKVLTPSIRSGAGSDHIPEIWITMNRNSREDAIAKKYLSRAEDDLAKKGYYEDDLLMVVEVNWRDNPWFPPELELERLDDKENLSAEEYDYIWERGYNESVENAIIKKEWFNAAIDAHITLGIEPTGATIASHDPADGGKDAMGYAARKGIYFFEVTEIEAKDGNTACHIATANAIRDHADLFVWDADGMGALLREQIQTSFKGVKCDVRAYHGGGEVEDKKQVYNGLRSLGSKDKPKTNGDTFYNKRAQNYMKLAQKFKNTYDAVVDGKYIDPDDLISINSKLPLLNKLRSEICRIPLKPNGAGKIQLMSKQEMLKLGINSPNLADCLAMAQEIPYNIESFDDIEFDDWG